MSSSPLIRNLTLADILPVVRVCNQSFLEYARFAEHGVQSVKYVAEHPAWQWGAFLDGRLAAFLLTEPLPAKQHVAIRLIAVDPGVKGKGLGSRLLAALDAYAPTGGFPMLSVGTPFAKGFYEKNGFRLVKTDIRMIRDITCQPVDDDPSAPILPLDFASAAGVVASLGTDELRRAFLGAFLGNVRRDASLMVRVEDQSGLTALAVGRTSEGYRDFAEMVFQHAPGGKLEPAVRAFERAASRVGLRYVGVPAAGEAQERELAALGYRRSEQDFYWTMYTLEKKAGG